MAKFKYKMQNILSIKYKLEDQAKIAYSISKKKLDDELEKLELLETKKSEYSEYLKKIMCSRLDVLEIRRCENAIETLKYNINVQKIQVVNAQHNLEKARIKMSDAMVERKTHEKLKENAFEVFVKEIGTAEVKEVDELVSFKYNNNDIDEDE